MKNDRASTLRGQMSKLGKIIKSKRITRESVEILKDAATGIENRLELYRHLNTCDKEIKELSQEFKKMKTELLEIYAKNRDYKL